MTVVSNSSINFDFLVSRSFAPPHAPVKHTEMAAGLSPASDDIPVHLPVFLLDWLKFRYKFVRLNGLVFHAPL
jgi:hypothetical protein